MKIKFERSGGFAGLRLAQTVDSAALAPEDAKKLQQLVQAARFATLPPSFTTSRPDPDRFRFLLTVEAEGKAHTVEVDEGAIPASLQALIKWLIAYGRKTASPPPT
jgi:hypothetical protein